MTCRVVGIKNNSRKDRNTVHATVTILFKHAALDPGASLSRQNTYRFLLISRRDIQTVAVNLQEKLKMRNRVELIKTSRFVFIEFLIHFIHS